MNKINKLNKAYSKRFKQINKNLLARKESGVSVLAGASGLLLFVEHLKYLRDIYIIIQQPVDIIATLNAAIDEFNAYQKTKKEFHWNNFCEFLKLNMKEWLEADDSI